ncbi:MAG: TonB-dependent receptor [Pseudomonadota bacterium]
MDEPRQPEFRHRAWPALAWTAGRAFSLACGALVLTAGAARADAAGDQRLADLSLEELSKIQITSVSKRPEPLSGAAASVFVITAEDIRRCGAASLPEVLRMAPNLQVGQVSAAGYAISARGMNGSSNSVANKLLVLIDGRSVYSPLFSGVFWDAQDVALEDIERIEIISGPGGTLWGVNAVNGVINIITAGAARTEGTLAAARLGARGADGTLRYGGALGNGGHYRVYAIASQRAHTVLASGAPVDDAWHRHKLGFRADWGDGAATRFSMQGSAYTVREEQPAPGSVSISGVGLVLAPITASGADLMAHWSQALDGGASVSAQAYLDHTERTVPPTFSETLDVADLQLQHGLGAQGMHSLVWGAHLRASRDRNGNSSYFAFLPGELSQKWASVFAQDDIALRPDWRLTLGSRIEHNDYTGNEWLPNARLAWQMSPARLLWAAVSRTVRAPSRLDRDAFIPGRAPFLLNGGSAVVSELAKVYELGYRAQAGSALSYAFTAFHNDYSHLRTQEIAPSRRSVVFASKMHGYADGLETWGSYQLTPAWRLTAAWTALRERFTPDLDSNDTISAATAGKDPAHTVMLRSALALGRDVDVDLSLRRVAALSSPAVPSYSALDARLAWQLTDKVELALVAQNLNGAHAEYGPLATRSEIARSLAVRLVWRN